MHNILKRLEEKVAFASNQTFNITTSSGPEKVEGAVAGVWGVHKALGGSGWKVTHIPTGYALASVKTQQDGKAMIDAIVERVPELLNATDKEVLVRNKELLIKVIKNPTGEKMPMDRDEIARILSDEGLGPQGTRYGKAGEMWGIGGSSRMIAIGRRDVMRNVFLAEINDEYSFRKPNTRWNNDEIEYQSKMDETRLRKWAQWAKKGLSTKDILRKVRDEWNNTKANERGYRYAHVTGREKNEDMRLVLGRLEMLTEGKIDMSDRVVKILVGNGVTLVSKKPLRDYESAELDDLIRAVSLMGATKVKKMMSDWEDVNYESKRDYMKNKESVFDKRSPLNKENLDLGVLFSVLKVAQSRAAKHESMNNGRLVSLSESQKMLTAQDLKKLPALYSQENVKDPMVWVKLFNPFGAGTWLATEYDPKEQMFFGYVMGLGGDELGYFSLRELQANRVERDKYWKPMKLSDAKAYEGKLHGER